MMNNDIQITVENVPKADSVLDDQWDPMKEEFENPDVNCYDHGPGANLDVNLQRPAYRDRNNQIVYKIMVSRIPKGLEQIGLENLFRNVGTPNVAKCHKNAPNDLNWALIEFKTLLEAKRAVVELDGLFNMRINFARSDEENERIRKKKQEEERIFNEISCLSSFNNNVQTTADQCQGTKPSNLKLLRMLGRGQSRGKIICNVFRGYQERRPGLKHCAWSNGVPDMRDPGGLIYDAKSCNHELSNRVALQNIIITAGSSSVRQVSMGRGYIPPHQEVIPVHSDSDEHFVGTDVSVPLLPCAKCGTETVQKCSLCGSPYCSKKCQRDDLSRHKTRCRPQVSIDCIVDDFQKVAKLVPLTRKFDQAHTTSSFSSNLPSINSLWGKPQQNVVLLLGRGTEAIVSVTSEQPTQLHGSLGCNEVFDITNKLLVEMPASVMQRPTDLNFWPSIGALVAVRWDSSIWRGYILNAPIVGNSSEFTVALCDLGSVKKIAVTDIMPLPSDYYDLPELAVTCTLVELNAEGSTIVPDKQLFLKIENLAENKLTAKAMSGDGLTELGIVTVTPWNPVVNELIAVQMVYPCSVVVSAYHNQHVLYVRPIGRAYKEQFFCLMQKVAAIHVTSRPLGRPPYKGEMVACQYEKDGNFYRGIVQEESSSIQGHYEVFFVDFGNIESISHKNMKALPHELKSCPCMAVPVRPYGVRGGPLTENAVHFLNTLLQKEQELQMDFASQNKLDGVQLNFPDKSSFNKQLNELLSPKWEETLKNKAENYNDKPTMLEDLGVISLIEGEVQKGTTTVMVMNISANGRLAVLPMGPPQVEHVLNTLAYQINEYCEATDPSDRYNPRVNEVCLAKYQKDGQWYRAVSSETVTETQSSKLMFIDYGNFENVPFANIRQIVSDFTSSPVVMLMCHLDGTPMESTPDVVQRIRDLVPTKNIYEVEVLSQIDSYQYKISIPEISNLLKSELALNRM